MRILGYKRKKQPAALRAGTATTREKVLGVLVLGILTALLLWLTALLCRPFLRLTSDPAGARAFFLSLGALGAAAFFGMEVLQGFLPIPLELSAVAAGYIFGRVQGFSLTVASVLLSTTLIYFGTRVLGHRLVDLFFTPARQRKAGILRQGEVRDLVTVIVFLIPGTPKRLFVFSAGLFPASFVRFLTLSTLARVPVLLACSFGGSALGSGDTIRAVLLFCIVAVPAVAALWIYRTAIRRH